MQKVNSAITNDNCKINYSEWGIAKVASEQATEYFLLFLQVSQIKISTILLLLLI